MDSELIISTLMLLGLVIGFFVLYLLLREHFSPEEKIITTSCPNCGAKREGKSNFCGK